MKLTIVIAASSTNKSIYWQFFSLKTCNVFLNAFPHQVGDEETKIEGRILYQEFDTWSPWISSDSPVSRLIPSKGFKMLSFLRNLLRCQSSYVVTFCRDRRPLARRWTSSFQLSSAPSPLSPSCFSSRSSLWRRRSRSWSMTLKRPRATLMRARSSNPRRSSQVQWDRGRDIWRERQ